MSLRRKDLRTRIDILYDMWMMEFNPERIRCSDDMIRLREEHCLDEDFLDFIKRTIDEI